MTLQTDSRNPSRKRPLSLVYVELSAANGGMMRDIAEDGFALRAMIPVRAGETTPFRFSLDEATRIEGQGLIDDIEEDGRVANIRFVQISSLAREQLLDWLNRSEAPPVAEPSTSPAHNLPNSSLEELRNELRTIAPVESLGDARPPFSEKSLPAQLPSDSQTSPQISSKSQHEPSPLESVQPQLQDAVLNSIKEVTPHPAQELLREVPATQLRKWPFLPKITRPEKPSPSSLPQPSTEFGAVPGAAAGDGAPELSVPSPLALPPLDPRDLPPAMLDSLQSPASTLEPLPSFEDGAHLPSFEWLSRFTLARAIGIMALLACIAGSIVFRQQFGEAIIWLGQQIAGAPEASPESGGEQAASAPARRSSSSSVKNPSNESGATAPSANPTPEISANQPASLPPVAQPSVSATAKNPVAPALIPAVRENRVEPLPVPAESSVEPGQLEFQQAQQLLRAGRNSGVRAEIPEAVRLLWASVEKGNVPAEIALADLYRTGDGVTKNCDQTRILLNAAARKGSPDAQKKLQDLGEHPCE